MNNPKKIKDYGLLSVHNESVGLILQQSQQLIDFVRFIFLLKIGGRMIYSTGSMNPIENIDVVAKVIYFEGSIRSHASGRGNLL